MGLAKPFVARASPPATSPRQSQRFPVRCRLLFFTSVRGSRAIPGLAARRWELELEVSAERLLALDRFEEGLEVALAEGRRAVALDHLEEHCRAVLRGLGE